MSVPVLRADDLTTLAGPRASECRVWWADPRHGVTDTLTGVLNEVELQRAARYHRAEDRDRFVTACWLLRVGAAGYLGVRPEDVPIDRRCPRCAKTHGKPQVSAGDRPLHVSVSHSGNRVAVSFTTVGPLGVDVEKVPETSIDGLTRCVLSPAEREILRRFPEPHRRAAFIRFWVRKEAVLKATGDGLRIPADRVEVSGPDEDPELLSWPLAIPHTRVHMRPLDPGDGYAGVVAVLADSALFAVRQTWIVDFGRVAFAPAVRRAA
jgi:4'-phosphopantetheinyl transferase